MNVVPYAIQSSIAHSGFAYFSILVFLYISKVQSQYYKKQVFNCHCFFCSLALKFKATDARNPKERTPSLTNLTFQNSNSLSKKRNYIQVSHYTHLHIHSHHHHHHHHTLHLPARLTAATHHCLPRQGEITNGHRTLVIVSRRALSGLTSDLLQLSLVKVGLRM